MTMRHKGTKRIRINTWTACVFVSMLFYAVAPGSVLADCTISTTALNFGEIVLPTTDPEYSDSFITVNCSVSDNYRISIDNGTEFQSPYRNMTNGGAGLLPYTLYQDPGYTTLWGDQSAAETGKFKTGTGTGADEEHTVYAVAYPSVNTVIGSYTDFLTVTISW